MEVLKINKLNKKIRHHYILKDISFRIQDHEIVGFIGPNGAGKSTTMKCICGLYHSTSGEIIINGYSIKNDKSKALSCLGVSIEYPSLYPNLTGWEHLKLVARWRNADKKRIEEMAEFSGLNEKLNHAAKTYSMGMKQRLVLSLAMLANPKVLILDEPMNGLDPQAVFELRKKISQIRDQGTSILLSSHQLNEVEQLADRIIFIKEGRIIDEQTMDQLREQRKKILLNVSDPQRIQEILSSDQIIGVEENTVCLWVGSKEEFAQLIEKVIEANIRIYGIEDNGNDLEQVYRRIYGEE